MKDFLVLGHRHDGQDPGRAQQRQKQNPQPQQGSANKMVMLSLKKFISAYYNELLCIQLDNRINQQSAISLKGLTTTSFEKEKKRNDY